MVALTDGKELGASQQTLLDSAFGITDRALIDSREMNDNAD